jgi:hypothetical protein
VCLLVLVLLFAACGDDTARVTGDVTSSSAPVTTSTAGAPSTSPTTTTTAAPSVAVVEDLVYRTGDPDPALIDVYHSTTSTGGPVVVLFHGGGVDNSFPLYVGLAEMLGERGAVVFVPDWDTTITGRAEDLAGFFDGAGCAVSFALAHAGEYGGSPDTLLLVGHSAGASPAAILAMRDPAPITDCAADMAPLEADGVVMWDGDLMMGGPLWDPHRDHIVELMEVATPWTRLDDPPRPRALLVTAARSRTNLRRCGVADPSADFWVGDPDGWFHDRLAARGALDDDCVDIGEAADLLADTMRDHGFDARSLALPNSGHEQIGDGDWELVVDGILGLATE